MNYAQFLREKITRLRLEKDISEYKLSLAIGKSKTYIQAVTSGKSLLSFDAFFDICDYFNLTPEEFFTQEPTDSARLRKLRRDLGNLSDEDLLLVENLVERLGRENAK